MLCVLFRVIRGLFHKDFLLVHDIYASVLDAGLDRLTRLQHVVGKRDATDIDDADDHSLLQVRRGDDAMILHVNLETTEG